MTVVYLLCNMDAQAADLHEITLLCLLPKECGGSLFCLQVWSYFLLRERAGLSGVPPQPSLPSLTVWRPAGLAK